MSQCVKIIRVVQRDFSFSFIQTKLINFFNFHGNLPSAFSFAASSTGFFASSFGSLSANGWKVDSGAKEKDKN